MRNLLNIYFSMCDLLVPSFILFQPFKRECLWASKDLKSIYFRPAKVGGLISPASRESM